LLCIKNLIKTFLSKIELLKPWACAEAEKATANYRLKQIRVLKARK